MLEVSVTTFRNHIPDYLEKVRNGEDIALTSKGKIIAKLTPPSGNERQSARQQLAALRATSRIGDVVSPLNADWEAGRAAA
ncbi:MAG: type II toxin-antitoxin system prevent-host-death family antitoxin [Gallionellaceae bacterium]|nr:MAG: type II toxin-antitoxin system prevent-host-death family antitoxin [Gallionellaceae bacterium]